MRIAEVTPVFPPYHAGIANVAYYNAWILATLNHDVTVFTPKYKNIKSFADEYPFQVKRLYPWFQYGKAGFLPQLAWQLMSYDVIHLHYPFFGGAEIIYFLDKIRDMKLVVTYHMDVVGTGLLSKFFHWHTEHVLPRILDRADKIIVTSWDYAKSSNLRERLEADKDQFVEIPCGVNHLLFKPRYRDHEVVSKYHLYDKQVILFVGALDKAHYFKGINILIKALQGLKDYNNFRAIIIGEGELKQSYQSMVDSMGLSKKVIFAGYVPDNLLPKFYSIADIFVLPSIDKSEAFGIVALEAMSSGVPVIASDLAGVRSVISKKETGLLVKPGNVTQLTGMIRYLLKNPMIAKRLGEAGRKKVLEQYTWERIGGKLEHVLQSVAKKR